MRLLLLALLLTAACTSTTAKHSTAPCTTDAHCAEVHGWDY